jgi:outer membrane protein assembly factor BamB
MVSESFLYEDIPTTSSSYTQYTTGKGLADGTITGLSCDDSANVAVGVTSGGDIIQLDFTKNPFYEVLAANKGTSFRGIVRSGNSGDETFMTMDCTTPSASLLTFGQAIWTQSNQINKQIRPLYVSPVLSTDGKAIYVVDNGNYLRAIDTATGSLIWKSAKKQLSNIRYTRT